MNDFISSINVIWKAAKDIWKYANRPNLKVEEIYVKNFEFPTNKGKHYRRFVIATIINYGDTRAENCVPHLFLSKNPKRVFKLHWADEPYEPRRDSTRKIDLEPRESRDLDIAFSVCGSLPRKMSLVQPSGSRIIISESSELTNVTYDPRFVRAPNTGGTFDPSLIRFNHLRQDETGLDDTFDEALSGSWIANPFALYNPQGYPDVFLNPGRHEVEGFIILSEGEGCSFRFVVESPKYCYNLSIDKNTIETEIKVED